MSTDTRPTVGTLGYEAICNLTTGDLVAIDAYRGVEAVGRRTGAPLGVADFGVIYLKTNDGDSATVLTVDNEADAKLIVDTLTNAIKVANSYTTVRHYPRQPAESGLSDDGNLPTISPDDLAGLSDAEGK